MGLTDAMKAVLCRYEEFEPVARSMAERTSHLAIGVWRTEAVTLAEPAGQHDFCDRASANIGLRRAHIRTYNRTYSDIGLKQSKMWPKGTVCITIAANIFFDACFPDSVVGFTPNPKRTNTEYVPQWFSFVQQYLEHTAPESAQKNLLRGLLVRPLI
jgi:hypothetical protein